MKKTARFLLLTALAAVFAVLPARAGILPAACSAQDFSGLGVRTVRSVKCASAPVPDGVISDGEYPDEGAAFSIGSGAYLTDQTGETALAADLSFAKDLVLRTHLTYDEDYFYFAFSLTLPEDARPARMKGESAEGFGFAFSLALTQKNDLCAAQSRLYNRYVFDSAEFLSGKAISARDFSGERTAVSADRLPESAPQLSLSWEEYRFNGCTADGVLWNAARYAEDAALRFSGGIVTAEIRVPVGDALLSVYPEERDGVRSALQTGGGFFGYFTVSVPAASGVFLTNARPASDVSFETDSGTLSLPEVVLADHPTEVAGVNRVAVLPSPALFSGNGSFPAPAGKPLSEGADLRTSSAPPPATVPAVSSSSVPVGSSVPDEEDVSPTLSGVVIPSFPDEEPGGNGEKGTDLLSRIIVLLTGALLLASVIGMYFILKKAEERERLRLEELKARAEAEKPKTAKIRPRRKK